jgi:hypothetical protein
MKKLALAAAAAAALLAGSLVVGVAPTSAAATSIGYTIIQNGDETCDLATIDLVDGTLTDMPAASSADACVTDIAADSQGAVWGISGPIITPGSVPAADVETSINIVAFSADGTPNVSPVFMSDAFTGTVLAFGGIAFDPTLGAVIQVGTNGTDPTCPSGAGVCLLTYDPETGVATPIGGSGMFSTPFAFLTSCSSALYTTYDPDGIAFATVSRTNGEVTDGEFVNDFPFGFDCAPGSDTLYGISNDLVVLTGNAPASSQAIGTYDPSTGDFTQIAPVSDSAADIYALAVPGAIVPVTTTTTHSPAVAAATVTPAFTG